MELPSEKFLRYLRDKKVRYRTITTICPEHTGNYNQKIIITKDEIFFSRCYCLYSKQEGSMPSVVK